MNMSLHGCFILVVNLIMMIFFYFLRISNVTLLFSHQPVELRATEGVILSPRGSVRLQSA